MYLFYYFGFNYRSFFNKPIIYKCFINFCFKVFLTRIHFIFNCTFLILRISILFSFYLLYLFFKIFISLPKLQSSICNKL